MSEVNSASSGPPQRHQEIEPLPGSGDQGSVAARDTLHGHALSSMEGLSPAQVAAKMSPASTRTFGRVSSERGAPGTSSPDSGWELALADDGTRTPAGRANAEAGEARDPAAGVRPRAALTKEEFRRGGKSKNPLVPVYDYRGEIPSLGKTWNPDTGVLTEQFPGDCAIKDPNKAYGGVVMDPKISQTIAYRGEATIGGKPGRMIEIKDMSGIHGYDKAGVGIFSGTGETRIHSVKMTQVDTGKKDASGNPIFESKQTAVIDKVTALGYPVMDPKTGKQALDTVTETMLNDDFNRQYEDLDPAVLALYAVKPAEAKVAETEERKRDGRSPRPALD